MVFPFLCVSLAFFALASSLPQAGKPPAFFLAGDSTTAVQSSGGGGWGTGFLSTLSNGAIGTNFGHNGRTTVSFVSGGDWTKVLDAVKQNAGTYSPYVTIQFGHNDQKPSANITIDEYKTNLANLASEAKSAGATPILVTPLSRRKYKDDVIVQDLAPQATATLEVAKSNNVAVIDLNAASTKYLNAIGEADAMKFNLAADDQTHLNAAGSVVFGNMVAGLILSEIGSPVKEYLKEDAAIEADIEKGIFVLPTTA